MIEILLSPRCVRKLKRELRTAGCNEIGGVLAAEQIADGKFLVKDLSVQRSGTPTSFIRDPVQHRKFMRRFHLINGNKPERFNYLGEWHSHPSFSVRPSAEDVATMTDIVQSPGSPITFAMLLIVRLRWRYWLDYSLIAFVAARDSVELRLTMSSARSASGGLEAHS